MPKCRLHRQGILKVEVLPQFFNLSPFLLAGSDLRGTGWYAYVHLLDHVNPTNERLREIGLDQYSYLKITLPLNKMLLQKYDTVQSVCLEDVVHVV